MKNILQYLDRVAVSSLPEGDVDMLHTNSVDVIGLRGHSIKRSWYHRELISSPKFRGKLLLLPDVGKFEIELKPFDPALLANGVCSRYPSSITLYKNRNRRINRFLIYSFYRMHILKSNQHAYWCFTQTLIRKSHSYLVACMHSVDKNIYRKKTLKELRMLLLRLNRMRGQFSTMNTQFGKQRLTTSHGNEILTISLMQHYLKFFRIYIPKNTDSYRPLGVPTLAWRIFQKMWLPPLLEFTSELIPDNFHGYIPRRGTGTAWRTILKDVIHKDNIFEVDFRQFFPSVDSDFLLNFMINKWKISLPVAVYLYQLNQSLPIFLESKSHDRLHGEVRFTPAHQVSLVENQAKLFAMKSLDAKRAIKGLSLKGLEDLDEYSGEEMLLRDYSEPMKPLVVKDNIFTQGNQLSYSPGNTRAWIEAQRVTPKDPNRALRKELGFEFKGNIGLPQGGTLSPYLSMLYLAEVFEQLGKPIDVDFLFYADDGMFYSDNLDSLEAWLQRISGPNGLAHFNIRIHPDKSHWVRKAGTWLRSLKFLGLVLIPADKISDYKLVAATRKGSKLEYDASLQNLTHLEYAQSLVFDKKLKVVHRKLEALNSFPDNKITRSLKEYYQNLALIAESKITPAQFEYGYFLQKLSANAVNFMLYTSTFLFGLRNKKSIASLLAILDNAEEEEPYEEVKINLLGDSAEEIFGKHLPDLESMLYSPKDVAKHLSVSQDLAMKMKDSPIVPSSIFKARDLPDDFTSEITHNIEYWFRKPHFYYDSEYNQKLALKGEDVRLHPYFLINLILKPFSTISGIWNPLLKLNESISSKVLHYFHRKYQFINLLNSKYFGLIMSRLYIGSKVFEVEQDFELGYVRDSLAEYLDTHSPQGRENLNVFTGSSYATREMVRMSAYLGLQSKFERDFVGIFPRSDKPFRLLAEPLLTEEAWDTDKPIKLSGFRESP